MPCQPRLQATKIKNLKDLACCLSFVLGLLGISGCSSTSFKSTVERNPEVEYQVIKTSTFPLSSAVRVTQRDSIRIYLGGDGIPWKGGTKNSNPSGTSRLAFELFLQDNKATHYISRPCYDIGPMPADCRASLWTSDRYSQEVIAVLAEAIMQIAGNSGIELVGYSGGGTLAVLLAQQLHQVTKVLTLGANLDHTAWTNFHGTPALSGSENPAVNGGHIRGKELHLFGQKDLEVPATINQRYFDNNPSANVGVIDNFDHRCCWLERWPEILNAWERSVQVDP